MLLLSCWLATLPAGFPQEVQPDAAKRPEATASLFHEPLWLSAADGKIAVEAPGWAAPTWHDVDGDGKKDLVVGQFNDGKLRIYKQTGRAENGLPQLAAGEWLKAGGEVAQVPGVW